VGKRTTWLICGLVALVPVAAGVVLDRLLGAAVLFTIAGGVVGALYLFGTFAANAPLFGRVAQVHPEPGRFSLTFDDGPDPRFTPEISRLLAERGHRATFFVLGRHASAYPALLKQLVADGHEVANHGYDHGILAFTRPRCVRSQLRGTEDAVAAATGSPPVSLFRAPHGVRSPWLGRAVGRAGYRVCGWTGSIFDTANPGVPVIVARGRRYLGPGSTLLLHDGDGSGRGGERRQTVEALPAILDEAEQRGLRSVLLSSLIERPRLSVSDLDRLGVPAGGLLQSGNGESLAREEDQAQAHPD